MNQDIKDALSNGGRVVVRKRKSGRGTILDTELCSRHIGLMAIAKAEAAGEIRVRSITDIPKGTIEEYELTASNLG